MLLCSQSVGPAALLEPQFPQRNPGAPSLFVQNPDPGAAALSNHILLSMNAAVDAVAGAFEGNAMELIRSDLSVQQEDLLRAAFAAGSPDTPN